MKIIIYVHCISDIVPILVPTNYFGECSPYGISPLACFFVLTVKCFGGILSGIVSSVSFIYSTRSTYLRTFLCTLKLIFYECSPCGISPSACFFVLMVKCFGCVSFWSGSLRYIYKFSQVYFPHMRAF